MNNKIILATIVFLFFISLASAFNDDINYNRDSREIIIMHEVNPPVHQYISYQSYLILTGNMKSEFENYIGTDSECSPGNCGNNGEGTSITEGSYEEDMRALFMNHFFNPDDNLDAGLCILTECYQSAYRRAQTIWDSEVLMNYPTNKSLSYYFLGRAAHLLEDMSIPAHTHLDPHWGPYGDDSYEVYMAEHFNEYNSEELEPVIANNLQELFLSMAEISDNFDSDDYCGEIDNCSRHFNCNEFGFCDIDNENSSQIGNELMKEIMKHVAGLYRLFWIETHPGIKACNSGECCDAVWKMTKEECIKDFDGDGFCVKGYKIINKEIQCPLEKNNSRGTDCNDFNKNVFPPYSGLKAKENIELCPGKYEGVFSDLNNVFVKIEADDIKILCNNTVINGSDEKRTYGFFAENLKNVSIINCTANNFHRGIFFYNVSNSFLFGNYGIDNFYDGIMLQSSSDIVILKNFVSKNNRGIWISDSKNILIKNNFVLNNVDGIYLSKNSRGNSVLNNSIAGSLFGIRIDYSSLNLIKENNILNNLRGISLFIDSFNNSVLNNSLTGNYKSVEINKNISYNRISGNFINRSYNFGIYVSKYSELNKIWNNYFYEKGIFDQNLNETNSTKNVYCINGEINKYYSGAEGPGCISEQPKPEISECSVEHIVENCSKFFAEEEGCDDLNENFCYKGNAYKNQTCVYFNCVDGKCIKNYLVEQKEVENCKFGCENRTCSKPNFILLNSPKNMKAYDYKNILIDVGAEHDVERIFYVDLENPKEKEIILCKNCKEYKGRKKFIDGFHNLSFSIEKDKILDEKIIGFFVDSKNPKIYKTYPMKNSFTNGEFGVKYQEDNVEEISFFYIGESLNDWRILENCDNKSSECWIEINLDNYNGELEYYFVIKDIAGNFVQSKPQSVIIDSKKPEIKSVNYSVSKTGVEFAVRVDEENLEKIEYKIDNKNWKRFCIKLKNEECTKKTSLYGEHKIQFRAVDKAGNFDEEEIMIKV